jgi:hypothetical protein
MSRVMLLIVALVVSAATSSALAAESNAVKIQRALSAAPAWVQAHATVVELVKGKMVVLRQGNNGFTCLPGTPGAVGDDPICMDAQAMIWAQSWMSHKPKPANTAPGVAYMLAGGTDFSTTDPWAKTGKQVYRYPPHWMLMWPFDPKASGLSSKFSTTGTWVMYAGTPYAHLMIMQKP